MYFYNQTFNAAFSTQIILQLFLSVSCFFLLFTVNTSQLCIERMCTATGCNFDVTWKLFVKPIIFAFHRNLVN